VGTAGGIDLYTAVAALGIDVFLGGMFAVIYLLDRSRHENAVFVGMTAALVPVCLNQLGLLTPIVGDSAPALVGVAAAVFLLGGSFFVELAFHVERPPRPFVALFVIDALVNFHDPTRGLMTTVLYPPVLMVAGGYALWRLLPLARRGERQVDAAVVLTGWMLAIVLALLEVVERKTGVRIGGFRLTPFSVAAFVLAHALMLAHHQVSRRLELEHTASELRRQIAQRSRELSEALMQLARDSAAPEIGRTIDGRYRIICERGRGGMGTVYEVERVADGHRLALKMWRGYADARGLARFAREAELAAGASHPNLVPIIDVGISDGTMFVVMPFVDGGSLEALRPRFGDTAWALPILAQIAAGLAELHARGIVHRDLKPANVLLADGVARISDFGVASLHDADPLAAATLDVTPPPNGPLTRAGELLGTPHYLAPELRSGAEAATPASDVFAAGVIAHELLAGESPGERPAALADLPRQLRELVERSLDPDPKRRPTAVELGRGFR
jgi:hypothetical protein